MREKEMKRKRAKAMQRNRPADRNETRRLLVILVVPITSVTVMQGTSTLLLLILPGIALAAIQCYVGQKLFALESNMAVCAPFIPYHCAVSCEWKHNCSSTKGYQAFSGRRTFVSGLLINGKSLMSLCCTSLATKVESDTRGERCAWRDWDSISVLGPSIRAEPVLGMNHYIRDIEMERDGEARVDVRIEVCQYQKELDNCKPESLTETDSHRLNLLKLRLDRVQNVEKELKPTQPISQ